MDTWFWIWLTQTYATGFLTTFLLMIVLAKAAKENMEDLSVLFVLGSIVWPVGMVVAIICAINMALKGTASK